MIKKTLVVVNLLALNLLAPALATAATTPTKPLAPAVTPTAVNASEHKYPHKGTRAQCQAAAKQQYPNAKDVAAYKKAVAACERA